MRIFLKKILGWALIPAVLSCSFYGFAEKREEAGEYELKGAFMVKFFPFITWPKKIFSNPKTPIVIGIIGKDFFGSKFTKMIADKNKLIDKWKFVIERFKQDAPITVLQGCHFLFISSSIARNDMKKIIDSLKDHPVATFGDVKGFCSLGGIINLVIIKEKLKFEINKGAADRLGIRFHSQLLKLAINLSGEKYDK